MTTSKEGFHSRMESEKKAPRRAEERKCGKKAGEREMEDGRWNRKNNGIAGENTVL